MRRGRRRAAQAAVERERERERDGDVLQLSVRHAERLYERVSVNLALADGIAVRVDVLVGTQMVT